MCIVLFLAPGNNDLVESYGKISYFPGQKERKKKKRKEKGIDSKERETGVSYLRLSFRNMDSKSINDNTDPCHVIQYTSILSFFFFLFECYFSLRRK